MRINYPTKLSMLILTLLLAVSLRVYVYHAPFSEHVFTQSLIDFKLPRILLGSITGALFALSGALLQETMQNKIASPDILGVSSCSILFVLGLKFLFPTLGFVALSLISISGAFIGFIALYWLALQNGKVTIIKFILIGSAIAIMSKAGVQWLLQHSPPQTIASLSYMVGSTYAASWQKVYYIGIAAVILFILAILNQHNLYYLGIDIDSAKSIGFNFSLARKISIVLAIFCASIAVMGVGNLGFVGLVAPNIARLISRNNKFWFLIFSAVTGMLLVVTSGALAKALFYPTEIPVGVITTIIGVPYFLWLLRKYF